MILGLIAKMLRKHKRKNKNKRKPVRRKVAARKQLSDSNKYLNAIKNATTGGSEKLEFPYKIPVIETSISLDAETHKTIKTATYALGGGIAIAGVAVAIGRAVSKK